MGNKTPTSYKVEYPRSLRWYPEIREIMELLLSRKATLMQDQREATDMILLEGNKRICCRVRGGPDGRRYSGRYSYDITITCRRETGALCEWHKMIFGEWGDWFFYGHGDEEKRLIFPWFLIDLSVARPWLLKNHGEGRPNRDAPGHRCWFYAFDTRRIIREIPKAIIAANGFKGLYLRPDYEFARNELLGHFEKKKLGLEFPRYETSQFSFDRKGRVKCKE